MHLIRFRLWQCPRPRCMSLQRPQPTSYIQGPASRDGGRYRKRKGRKGRKREKRNCPLSESQIRHCFSEFARSHAVADQEKWRVPSRVPSLAQRLSGTARRRIDTTRPRFDGHTWRMLPIICMRSISYESLITRRMLRTKSMSENWIEIVRNQRGQICFRFWPVSNTKLI